MSVLPVVLVRFLIIYCREVKSYRFGLGCDTLYLMPGREDGGGGGACSSRRFTASIGRNSVIVALSFGFNYRRSVELGGACWPTPIRRSTIHSRSVGCRILSLVCKLVKVYHAARGRADRRLPVYDAWFLMLLPLTNYRICLQPRRMLFSCSSVVYCSSVLWNTVSAHRN